MTRLHVGLPHVTLEDLETLHGVLDDRCRLVDGATSEWTKVNSLRTAVAEALYAARRDEEANPERFTCPKCDTTSYNPNDIAEGYCGACHDFTGRQGLRT